MPKRVIWVFVACCIAVAVWNTFPHTPDGFMGELRHKSEQLKSVAADTADWLGLDTGDGGTPERRQGTKEKGPAQVKPVDEGKAGQRQGAAGR